MRPFVEEARHWNMPEVWITFVLADRHERFRKGNDKVWGEGNWIMCGQCEDGMGYPAFHHRDFHT